MRISPFFALLIIGVIFSISFVAILDFASAKVPPAMPTYDFKQVGEEVAEVNERIPAKINFLFYATSALLGLLTITLLFLSWAAGIGMYMGPDSLGYIFYDVGYAWVLGMVNMFFVIAFVFAALLYILDVEWGIIDKKTLPRLIIVAFLINFSALLVKIIADFFIILERGVFEQLMPGGLTSALTIIGVQAFINWYIWVLVPYLVLLKIPTLIATIKGFFTFGITSFVLRIKQLIILPMLATPFIMEAVTNILLSIVFFTYAVLFIARSVAIYIFLMLAPLAIACTIFPKTRKYFDGWLKQLFLWGSMGTIIFFILSFGFQMRNIIVDGFNIGLTEGFVMDVGVGMGGIMIFVANLFFAVYAIISLFIIKRFLPSAAQGIVGTIQKGATVTTIATGGIVGKAALLKYGGGVEKTIGRGAKALGIKEESFAGGVIGDVREKIRGGVKKEREKMANRFARADISQEERERIAREGDEETKKAIYEAGVMMGDDIDDAKIKGIFGCVRKNSRGKMIDRGGNEVKDIKDAAVDYKQFEEIAGSKKKLKSDHEHIASLSEIDNCKDKQKFRDLVTAQGTRGLTSQEQEVFDYLDKNLSTKDKDDARNMDKNLDKELEDTHSKIMRSASDGAIKKIMKGLSGAEKEAFQRLALGQEDEDKVRAALGDSAAEIQKSAQNILRNNINLSITATGEEQQKHINNLLKQIQSNFSEETLKLICRDSKGKLSFDLMKRAGSGELKDQAEKNELARQLSDWSGMGTGGMGTGTGSGARIEMATEAVTGRAGEKKSVIGGRIEAMKKEAEEASKNISIVEEYIGDLAKTRAKLQEEIGSLEKEMASLSPEKLGDQYIGTVEKYNLRFKEVKKELGEIEGNIQNRTSLLDKERRALNKLTEMIKEREGK